MEKGLPLVSFSGQLVCTHELLKLPLRYVFQNVLYVQVQSVVEVSTPEEVSEAQADVKGAKLFVAQRKQSEDVNEVLVPPKHFLTSRGQVAVNKPKRCSIEEEGDPNRSLVSQSVTQASLHTGSVHMTDATLVLRLHKHSQPHIPEGLYCHLFEVDLSIAAKGCFDMLSPLSLPLRVFLSPQSVDVMRQQGDRLIRGVSQTTAGYPRLQAARRR